MKNSDFEKVCLSYREQTNFKIKSSNYALVMLDGRTFSSYCKKFNRPYDDEFIRIMNETCIELLARCNNVCFGYVQSDEINLILRNTSDREEDLWFKGRISKIISIMASIASSKFNELIIKKEVIQEGKPIDSIKLIEFDCRVWNVPSINEAIDWIVYRQRDCIRNSKLALAQNYFSYNELVNKKSDEQIQMVLDKYNCNWYDYDDGAKYGRFVFKTKNLYFNANNEPFYRTNKTCINAFNIEKEGRNKLYQIINN